MRAKNCVFRNYWWLALLLGSVGVSVVVVAATSERETLIAGVIGGILGFCYFVQTQKLEEYRLFKELFTGFNERYDRLNDRLADIKEGKISETDMSKTLIDYFNLSAEEFLFFDEGYIHPAVWRSWCRGILEHLGNEKIGAFWATEVERDPQRYYGLNREKLAKGAVA